MDHREGPGWITEGVLDGPERGSRVHHRGNNGWILGGNSQRHNENYRYISLTYLSLDLDKDFCVVVLWCQSLDIINRKKYNATSETFLWPVQSVNIAFVHRHLYCGCCKQLSYI